MNFWDWLEISDICLIHTLGCCNQRHDPMSDTHFQFLFWLARCRAKIFIQNGVFMIVTP